MEENQLEKLVDKAKQGDSAAFEELYSISSRQVYFTCISFLGNEEDAKDVMQDVYITAYEKLSSLNDAEKFVPWVNRIAVNLCKKILMKKSAVFMEIENAADELTEENENFLPEEYITQKEKRKLVMDIMRDTLSDIQYKTVILYYFNGLSVEEIADIMECPPGTVKYRLSVARAKIKDGVDAYENKSGDKLYSVVGLPLLMRLLNEEANSIDVPDMLHDIMEAVRSHLAAGHIESTDASSITNTASTNNTTNTSKGGTIKKMLKTPKTIIAATAATVVIIGGIAAAVIATNHENTPSSGSQTRQESQQASSGAESEDQQIFYDPDGMTFWLHIANWGEEKDLTGITLFNGECTAPIHLEDFDGDEHLAPYRHYEISSYNLTELFDSDEEFYGEKMYSTQATYDEETEEYIDTYLDEEDKATIRYIYLYNYGDAVEYISVRETYENNWFYIEPYAEFIDEFNFDDRPTFTNYEVMIDIFYAIIDKFGRPSYVIAYDPSFNDESKESFLEILEQNNGHLDYDLVWEQEEFVLVLKMWESIDVDKESHDMSIRNPNYGAFLYLSAEVWPNYKEASYHFENEYRYNIIYDLDDLR